jgi:hypothetical protein
MRDRLADLNCNFTKVSGCAETWHCIRKILTGERCLSLMREMESRSRLLCICRLGRGEEMMKNTKFVVRASRVGTAAITYVQRIDRTPIQMTIHRRQALLMGRFTAEDAVDSIRNSRCHPELVPVLVSGR